MNNDFKSRLAPCWPVLIKHGADKVVFSYSGSGDSGMFEHVGIEPELSEDAMDDLRSTQVDVMCITQSFNPNTGKWNERRQIETRSVLEAITEAAEDILAAYHGGWENNAGGEGNVILDCREFKVLVEHREFVHSYNDYSDTMDVSPADLERLALIAEAGGSNAPQ